MDKIERAEICEKAAAIIREKGKADSELWPTTSEREYYEDGPVCAIGALSIASGTHQDPNNDYNNYDGLVDPSVLDVVASSIPEEHHTFETHSTIYNYSDCSNVTAEDIAEVFEKAAKYD